MGRKQLSLATEEEALRMLFPKDSDLPKELLDPLLSAVGALVLAWGAAESTLHLIIVSAFDDAGGKCLGLPFPRALTRKIDFLRECFKKLGSLKPLETEGRSLLERVAELGLKRHGIIHAVVTGFEIDTGRIRFTSLDADTSGHLIKIARHSILEINQLCLECTVVSTRLVEFDLRLHEAIMGQKPIDDGGSPA